jgi:anti-anti-sigma factor
MFSVDLDTRECDGQMVVVLCGELDVTDAAGVAAALAAIATREPAIIVDLAGLKFIDSSGLAALAHARKQARHSGGDLQLAGPQQQVMRILTITRLIEVFSVYASVREALDSAGRARQMVTPATVRPVLLAAS